jgi:glycosyltransferase involved in cell wall biosynthesis
VLRHAECDEGYTTASRFTCLHLAVALTHRLRGAQQPEAAIQHIHAHFAHDPTLIAQLVHRLTGLPFTFTAHARDLYQIPQAALAERVAAARTVFTCCSANLDYLHKVAPESVWPKIHLIHHGVNLRQFQPVPCAVPAERHPQRTPLLLSVGRLVEKKGFLDLLHACAELNARGHCFRCLIYGEGPLADQLTALIAELELAAMVKLMGACPQEAIITMMQQSDIFVLTPYVTADGDRDGVPNVLVEAMACGLPVVATTVGGIPELVTDQHNGLLSAPHDIAAIATNLSTLLESATLRRQLGLAARQTVEQKFDLDAAARQLLAIFTKSPA